MAPNIRGYSCLIRAWLPILVVAGIVTVLLLMTPQPATDHHGHTQTPNQRDIPDLDSTIARRASSSWLDTIYHGNWLLCIMNAPMQTIYQSPWTDYNSLHLHGWTAKTELETNQDKFNDLALNKALTALGINTDCKQWVGMRNERFLGLSNHDGFAVRANYVNIFNVNDGAIIAHNNWGPDHQATTYGIPKDRVPPLKQWSDVVFLEWQRLTGGQPGKLRNINHVFRHQIANKKTVEMLRRAMGDGDVEKAPEVPGPWPGYQWNINQDNAKAALTTSNSIGVSYLLAQHKEQLGVRVVDQVNVFNCQTESRPMWCLYFHIRDGPLDKASLWSDSVEHNQPLTLSFGGRSAT